jgi:hypothetical protein
MNFKYINKIINITFLKTVFQIPVNPHEGWRRHPFTCPWAECWFGASKRYSREPDGKCLCGLLVLAFAGMPKLIHEFVL